MSCVNYIVAVWCILLSQISNTSQVSLIRPRTLSSTRLKRVAESTDYDEFNTLLKPILKSRIVGTVGHHAVKQWPTEESFNVVDLISNFSYDVFSKHLIKFFQDLGWQVTLDEFDKNTVIGMKRFTNIIATANPNAKKFVLLTAHYDSKIMKGNEFLAATDSAVPCAMIMSIAKSLNLNELKKNNDVSLQVALFDGEEAFVSWTADDSIYGSTHLAKLWSQEDGNYNTQLSKIEFLILLDLIGEKNPKFYSGFRETHRYFERLQQIEKRLKGEGLISKENSYFVGTLQPDLGIEDDHIPFLRKGVPILHIIPVPFPNCWHKLCDNGKNIDEGTVHDLLKIFHAFFKEIMRV